jgi:hypothetical protein
MAVLPDLDTTQISFIAFWNAIDQGGVSSIDPEDALSDGRINSYTLYDNGWEGSYSLPNISRSVTVRVKSDGWLIAYMDQTEDFTLDTGSPPHGPWDILNDWTDYQTGSGSLSAISDLQTNNLERCIQSLYSNLGNSESITYNSSDVDLYDYLYNSAGEYVLYSSTLSAYSYENKSDTQAFLYSSKTIHHGVIVGAGYRENKCNVDIDWDPSGNNVAVIDTISSGGGDGFGTYDTTADIGTADTEHETYLQADSNFHPNVAGLQVNHLIWSSDA